MSMSETTYAEHLQKRTNRFLRASEVGLICLIIITAANSFIGPYEAPHFIRYMVVATFIVFFVSLLVLFWYRNADEYTKSLWKIGTSVAFLFFVLAFLFNTLIAYPVLHFGMGLGREEFLEILDAIRETGVFAFFLGSIHVRRFMERGF